jgi:hypothetical protein
MSEMKRHFPHHQYEGSPFFQGDIRRPNQQIGADARRDRRHRVDGTGRDDHSIRQKTTGSELCADIFQWIAVRSEGLEVFGQLAGFQIGRTFGAARQDEVRFEICVPIELFEEP